MKEFSELSLPEIVSINQVLILNGLNDFKSDLIKTLFEIQDFNYHRTPNPKYGKVSSLYASKVISTSNNILNFVNSSNPIISIHSQNDDTRHHLVTVSDNLNLSYGLYVVKENNNAPLFLILNKPYKLLTERIVRLSVSVKVKNI